MIWKGGVTEAGARATFSHTGSLATPGAVWNAMVRQSGAVGVGSLDAMLDAVEMLARGRRVEGRRMGLVAMTGGQSVVITDTFASAGLGDSDAVGFVVRRTEELLQYHRRQLSQSARRGRHDRRRRQHGNLDGF